jgi:hypothetical protein
MEYGPGKILLTSDMGNNEMQEKELKKMKMKSLLFRRLENGFPKNGNSAACTHSTLSLRPFGMSIS